MNRAILDPAEVLLLEDLKDAPPMRTDFELKLLGLLQRLGFVRDKFEGLSADQLRCVRQAAALAQSRDGRIIAALEAIEPMARVNPRLQPGILDLMLHQQDPNAPVPKTVVAAVNMLHQGFVWKLPYQSPDSECAGHLSARVVEREFKVVPQPDGLYSVLTSMRGRGLVTVATDLPDQNSALGLAARLQGANRLSITLRKSEGAFRCQVRALCGGSFSVPLNIAPLPAPAPARPLKERLEQEPAHHTLAIAA